MPERILVPLDQFMLAEFAVPIAMGLTDDDGKIDLVSVVEPAPVMAYSEYDRIAREASEKYLGEVAKQLADSGVETSTTVLSGPPASTLLDQIKESHPDVVVMATHGRGPFTRVWLGSVADRVVRRSPRPVILVKPHEDEEVRFEAVAKPEVVAVALDGSELAEHTIDAIGELEFPDTTRYHLVRVITYPHSVASPYLPHAVIGNREFVDQEREEAEAYMERTASRLREEGRNVTWKVTLAEFTGPAIVEEADSEGADMIAVATHGHSGVMRLALGSVADKVIRLSDVPVFVAGPKLED
jgi:nucleotide-binding universal stress UspA family protein